MKKRLNIQGNKKWIGVVGVFVFATVMLLLVKGMSLGAQTRENIGEVTFTLRDGWYLVENQEQLLALGKTNTDNPDSKFKLVNDIEVSEVTEAATSNFAGVFDGQDYKITYRMIDIKTVSASRQPYEFDEGILFGTVTGVVKNLFVEVNDASYEFNDTYEPTLETDDDFEFNLNEGEIILDPQEAEDQKVILEGIETEAYTKGEDGYESYDEVPGIDRNDPETEQTYYFKQGLKGTVTKDNVKIDKRKKTVNFGLIGAVNGGTIHQLHMEGDITASTVENDYLYEISYVDHTSVIENYYYKVVYTGLWKTKSVEIPDQYIYSYATEDGQTFDLEIPLYDENDKPKYEQYEDENGVFWFDLSKDDSVTLDQSLVYGTEDQKDLTQGKPTQVTREEEIPERYAYEYAFDGAKADLDIPLYKDDKPIYEQYEDDNGKFWFHVPQEDGTEDKKYPVYDDGADSIKEQGVVRWLTKKVMVNDEEKYAHIYAYSESNGYDYDTPLYNENGTNIYQENNGFWKYKGSDISPIYDEDAIEAKFVIEPIEITKKVDSEIKYTYLYTYDKETDFFDFDTPLYEGKIANYKQYVDTDGTYWFDVNDKYYPVYDTENMSEYPKDKPIPVVDTRAGGTKYAYQYAVNENGEYDYDTPLYEGETAKFKQHVDLDGTYWFVDDQGENTIKYPIYDTNASEADILTKTQISAEEYFFEREMEDIIQEMKTENRVKTAADLYTGAVVGRIPNGEISSVIQKTAVTGKYIGTELQNDDKRETNLYIGGIAGFMDEGAKVSDLYIAKSMSADITGEGLVNPYTADITGSGTQNVKAEFFIIDNGTKGIACGDLQTKSVGYTTWTGTELESGIKTITPEEFNGNLPNWKYFAKDVTGEKDVYTLQWLVKDNRSFTHEITEDHSVIINITDSADPANTAFKINKGMLKYLYRPSVNNGEVEKTATIGEAKNAVISNNDLRKSAYLLVKQIYCTDSKYYYFKEYDDKNYIYPYMEGARFITSYEEDLLRDNDQDYIQVLGNMPQSGTNAVFYYITNINKYPVGETDTSGEYSEADTVQGAVDENGSWRAGILFNSDRMQIKGFWTVDDKIYPVSTSERAFTEDDRQTMEAPKEFSISRYYKDENPLSQHYATLPIEQEEATFVYAGQMIKIVECTEESVKKNIQFFYVFSTEEEPKDDVNYYLNNGVTYAYDFSTGISNLTIPDGYKENDVFYLHVLKSKKNMPGGISTLKLKMTSVNEIKPSKPSNSVVLAGTSITLNVGKLDGRDGITGIRYLIHNKEIPNLDNLSTRNDATVLHNPGENIDIKLERTGDEMRKYLYVQYFGTYDGQAVCGPVQMLEYAFADKTGNPTITPNTITYSSEAGVLGAFNCDTNTKVELNAAKDSRIIYNMGESETTEISVSKVNEENILNQLTEHTQNGENTCVLMERLYVKSNDIWYLMSKGAKEYKADEGITLTNTSQKTKYVHISAVAFEENREYSDSVHYVYEVEPKDETAAPTAVLITSADAPTAVSLNSSLFFQSITPDAEIYYTLDGTEPDTKAGGSTKKYDAQKGITVTGEYAGLFRVNLIAVKKDSNGEHLLKPSNSVSFVYKIEEQDTVQAPTSIPVTSEANPAVLSPGKQILLSTATNGAEIYYTVDGTEPVINEDGSVKKGTKYDASTGIIMPEDGSDFFTIKAIAIKSGMKNSQVVQLTFRYPDKVLAPYASPASGVVESGTSITLTNATDGATIYYEIAYGDNKPKTPTVTSAVFDSKEPFIITKKTTIKAIAVKDGVKSKTETFTYQTSKLSNAPIASINSGSVVSRGTLLRITSQDGSAVYYTTDGSDPSEASNSNVVEGQTLLLDGEYGSVITVKACAKAADRAFSEVSTYTYQISKYQGGVTSDLESGSEASSGATVNLMSDIGNATIYFTVDGTSPSAGSASGTAVTLSGEPGTIVTVKAMAIPEGVTVDAAGSSTAIFNYKIKDTITAPQASPAGGTLTSQISVTLTAAKGEIYYTIDGSTPTVNSTLYKEPIAVNKSMEIKAIAATPEGEVSPVATFTYTTAMRVAKPMSSLADGILEPGTVVTLSSGTNDAVIYYSTDGTRPTADNLNSLLTYEGEGITINRTVNIKAVAYKDGYLLSNVAEFHFEVNKIPTVIEREKREAEEAEKGLKDTDATALKDKRGSEVNGPTYTGIILKESEYDTLVAADKEIIPESSRLIVQQQDCESIVQENLSALLGEEFEMIQIYDMKIYEDSKSIQPGGKLEIGIPIPEGYENAALQIVYVDEQGTIAKCETRRSNGVAYAITDHFSLYGLAGVKNEEQNKFTIDVVYLVAGAALVIMVTGIIFFIIQKRRKKRPKRVM